MITIYERVIFLKIKNHHIFRSEVKVRKNCGKNDTEISLQVMSIFKFNGGCPSITLACTILLLCL